MSSDNGTSKPQNVLTGAEVLEIIGAAEDEVVLDILETGATAQQVLEAFERVSGNTSLGEDLEKPADTTVLQIMEILSRDQELEDEE